MSTGSAAHASYLSNMERGMINTAKNEISRAFNVIKSGQGSSHNAINTIKAAYGALQTRKQKEAVINAIAPGDKISLQMFISKNHPNNVNLFPKTYYNKPPQASAPPLSLTKGATEINMLNMFSGIPKSTGNAAKVFAGPGNTKLKTQGGKRKTYKRSKSRKASRRRLTRRRR